MFTLTTLSENPEYFEEVITLIEKEFHYSSDHSYAQDFSLLMNPLNFENCYLYIDSQSNRVVSHLAVCPRTMIKDQSEIRVGLIGGIVTVKEYRGRELFKNLMNHALEEHSKDCGLFILWSEITGLYEKFSFYLSGGQIETGHAVFTASECVPGFQRTKFKDLSPKDFQSIQNLYAFFNQRYFFTVKREEKEWSIIRDLTSIDLYIKKNESGTIEQYFCVNKGRDLSNIIHEIGCVPDQYISLMKNLQKFKTWLPESELSLSNNSDIFYSAFFRLGHLNVLKEFLSRVSQDKLQLIEIDNDIVQFKFNQLDYRVSQQDFLQHLFGPRPLKEFEPFLLSPYIPGTDSI